MAGRESAIGQHQSVSTRPIRCRQGTDRPRGSSQVSVHERWRSTVLHLFSVPLGESPPPRRGTCFGRNELIEEIVGFAENLESIALIGAGGIGKTSIALAVLHHDRIKDRFGDNRRFIRCDQFPTSRIHFLARLSQVVGAGIEHPKDLAPLRPFLSSRKMILFLDNAESILDPQGTDSREIYTVVEELSHFENICLGITSRISTVPPHCKRPTVPTLSMESACDIFYAICGSSGRSDVVRDLIKRLDFHALSITLLATTACHNAWDYDRLAAEWDTHRAGVLRTDHDMSPAATIELSLASPTFRQLIPPPKSHKLVASPTFSKFIPSPLLRKLPPSARELLEVVAFFPQGIDEKNLDWLFPTTPDRKNIFDKFCNLSLTYRDNGFITMLAPIRDHLCPRDPKSSPLLRATKDRYLTRLSFDIVDPGTRRFEEAKWIKSEDINVEHLLDVFTSIDMNAHDVWRACDCFMEHLYWHKPRQTLLGPKIEGLPDGHRSKAGCLLGLSRLFQKVGNSAEEKRLLTHALSLWKQTGDDLRVAQTLLFLSNVNQKLGSYKEGIRQTEEALKIYNRFGILTAQVNCLTDLARSLLGDGQLDAAESVALRTIDLLPKTGQQFLLCRSHCVLGEVYSRKGKKEKAVCHFRMALRIASPFNWHYQLFRIHYNLAQLFLTEEEFGDANTHIEHAKPHAVDDKYLMGLAMELQALVWYRQCRLEDARCEALGALERFEKLGVAKNVGKCREVLRKIDRATENRSISDEPTCGEPSEHGAPSHHC